MIYGQINQFDSATGTDTFLGDSASKNTLSYGYFDGENTMFNGTEDLFSEFVEDDVFKATVEVAGSFPTTPRSAGTPRCRCSRCTASSSSDSTAKTERPRRTTPPARGAQLRPCIWRTW